MNSDEMNQIKTVSFFCGCGGLDLGFSGGFTYKGEFYPKTSFDILAAYDNNEKCIETYHRNISKKAYVSDLTAYNPEDVPAADVLIGGFPCQDFATCGPRRGLNSTRGRLYQAMIKYMQMYHPRIVIGENVPGLANIKSGEILKTILSDIENVGYQVKVWRMFAPDYGVPQRRERLIIVAVRNDIPGFPDEPMPTFNTSNYRTTKWAIGDLEKCESGSIPNQEQYFKAAKAKAGNGQGDETNVADAPAYTIRANAKSRIQFHYSKNRRLTIRECARIQSFPDDFIFPHSMTTNISQIGNAVPPILAYQIAQSIHAFIGGTCHE